MIYIRTKKTFLAWCIIWAAALVAVIALKQPVERNENSSNETIVKTEYVYITEYEKKPSYYGSIDVSQDDKDTLARLVYLEARNQPTVGQRCVVEVVLNRICDSRFPNTVHDVVYQDNPLQFSTSPYLADANPTQVQYDIVDEVLSEENPILNTSTVYFSTFPQTKNISAIINDHYFCS